MRSIMLRLWELLTCSKYAQSLAVDRLCPVSDQSLDAMHRCMQDLALVYEPLKYPGLTMELARLDPNADPLSLDMSWP